MTNTEINDRLAMLIELKKIYKHEDKLKIHVDGVLRELNANCFIDEQIMYLIDRYL